ncbi:MAG: NAD(P)/FAD-dependent oxidoreductase [Pseudomonadota bacterium]
MSEDNASNKTSVRPKVVIIGAGFGGLSAAKRLERTDVDITVLDRRNYHLFQPLLYQVATADLSPAHVAWPIRGIFAKQKNVNVALCEVLDVDLENKRVIGDTGNFEYDYLIVANGSRHSYFGNDHWEEHAPGLKRIIDATEIRKRVLMAFERAEIAKTEADQNREMTFVIVGGGPTGVEMAGAIAELARFTLASDFRNISSRDARIILVEAGDTLLRGFPSKLCNHARTTLEKLGVEVQLESRVSDVTDKGAVINDEFLPAATIIWGAGVEVKNARRWLKVETDRSGRIPVGSDLSLEDYDSVFIIGDAAKVSWKEGMDVPGIAPAAKQMGKYVGQLISHKVNGKALPPAFTYKHMGSLATIGRHSAVIDFGKWHMTGFLAWWLWGIAHIYFLIGVRSPVLVAANWLWSYLTYSKGARLITHLRTTHVRKSG